MKSIVESYNHKNFIENIILYYLYMYFSIQKMYESYTQRIMKYCMQGYLDLDLF